VSAQAPATTAQTPADQFDTRGVIAVSGSHAAHDVYGSMISTMLPLLIERFGIPIGAAGALLSAFRLPSIFQPFLGYWADKYDARLLVVIMPTVSAVAVCSLGWAPTYAVALVLLAIAGFSSAAFHPAAGALVTRVGGQSWGRASAYFGIGGELGRMTGPLLAGIALLYLAFESFVVLILPALAWSIYAYTRIAGKNARIPRPPPPAALRAAIAAQKRPLALIAMIVMLRSLSIASFQSYYPTYMNLVGGSALWIAAFALTLYEVGAVGGQLFGGHFSDRFGRRSLMLLSQLTAGPALFGALSYAGQPLGFVCLVLGGFLAMSAGSVQMALMQELLPNNRSVAVGISYFLGFESQLVATLVVGFAADVVGLSSALSVSVWLSMASIPFTLLLPETRGGAATH